METVCLVSIRARSFWQHFRRRKKEHPLLEINLQKSLRGDPGPGEGPGPQQAADPIPGLVPGLVPGPVPGVGLREEVRSKGKRKNDWSVPIHKWPICPISALREKFNPRNITICLRLNFSRALISTKFAYLWMGSSYLKCSYPPGRGLLLPSGPFKKTPCDGSTTRPTG